MTDAQIKDTPQVLYLTERATPTKPGFYYAREKDHDTIKPVEIARTYGDSIVDGLYVVFGTAHQALNRFVWYGPLPELRRART